MKKTFLKDFLKEKFKKSLLWLVFAWVFLAFSSFAFAQQEVYLLADEEPEHFQVVSCAKEAKEKERALNSSCVSGAEIGGERYQAFVLQDGNIQQATVSVLSAAVFTGGYGVSQKLPTFTRLLGQLSHTKKAVLSLAAIGSVTGYLAKKAVSQQSEAVFLSQSGEALGPKASQEASFEQMEGGTLPDPKGGKMVPPVLPAEESKQHSETEAALENMSSQDSEAMAQEGKEIKADFAAADAEVADVEAVDSKTEELVFNHKIAEAVYILMKKGRVNAAHRVRNLALGEMKNYDSTAFAALDSLSNEELNVRLQGLLAELVSMSLSHHRVVGGNDPHNLENPLLIRNVLLMQAQEAVLAIAPVGGSEGASPHTSPHTSSQAGNAMTDEGKENKEDSSVAVDAEVLNNAAAASLFPDDWNESHAESDTNSGWGAVNEKVTVSTKKSMAAAESGLTEPWNPLYGAYTASWLEEFAKSTGGGPLKGKERYLMALFHRAGLVEQGDAKIVFEAMRAGLPTLKGEEDFNIAGLRLVTKGPQNDYSDDVMDAEFLQSIVVAVDIAQEDKAQYNKEGVLEGVQELSEYDRKVGMIRNPFAKRYDVAALEDIFQGWLENFAVVHTVVANRLATFFGEEVKRQPQGLLVSRLHDFYHFAYVRSEVLSVEERKLLNFTKDVFLREIMGQNPTARRYILKTHRVPEEAVEEYKQYALKLLKRFLSGGAPQMLASMPMQHSETKPTFEDMSPQDWEAMADEGKEIMADFAAADAEVADVEAVDEEVENASVFGPEHHSQRGQRGQRGQRAKERMSRIMSKFLALVLPFSRVEVSGLDPEFFHNDNLWRSSSSWRHYLSENLGVNFQAGLITDAQRAQRLRDFYHVQIVDATFDVPVPQELTTKQKIWLKYFLAAYLTRNQDYLSGERFSPLNSENFAGAKQLERLLFTNQLKSYMLGEADIYLSGYKTSSEIFALAQSQTPEMQFAVLKKGHLSKQFHDAGYTQAQEIVLVKRLQELLEMFFAKIVEGGDSESYRYRRDIYYYFVLGLGGNQVNKSYVHLSQKHGRSLAKVKQDVADMIQLLQSGWVWQPFVEKDLAIE